ncbi:hypothetical protein AG1IA_02728 [Rhizoctonia solani AG-1 IA]|uniref:Uncharacterized protein n=1 Tax=Thanatephorus cucumeris (strain AG1-IA) TaxID=983506 RepID=L8X2B9_THACA|nr:hypothetical protein AG1IA_02728 [Rhizoctonia solani AG-1 IA]
MAIQDEVHWAEEARGYMAIDLQLVGALEVGGSGEDRNEKLQGRVVLLGQEKTDHHSAAGSGSQP